MVLLETNFRAPVGEIDLIARDGECLVFIEVKARESFSYGFPEEAITRNKQNRIRKTALYYLLRQGLNPEVTIFRFDVIAIQLDKAGHPVVINHYPNAF